MSINYEDEIAQERKDAADKKRRKEAVDNMIRKFLDGILAGKMPKTAPETKLFPMLPADEYEALKQAIKDSQEITMPILIDTKGRLIDGRNRIKVLLELGPGAYGQVDSHNPNKNMPDIAADIHFKDMTYMEDISQIAVLKDLGAEMPDFATWKMFPLGMTIKVIEPKKVKSTILGANIMRRHLTPKERVDITLQLLGEPATAKENAQAGKKNLKKGKNPRECNVAVPEESPEIEEKPTVQDIADKAGVSKRTVAREIAKKSNKDKPTPKPKQEKETIKKKKKAFENAVQVASDYCDNFGPTTKAEQNALVKASKEGS